MFMSSPFLTSLMKSIPVSEEGNWVNKVSVLTLEQFEKKSVTIANRNNRCNIIESRF